jgi:hypothetical protein
MVPAAVATAVMAAHHSTQLIKKSHEDTPCKRI